MMISTKLLALRKLLAQHARVALSADQQTCMEHQHFARLFAVQYRSQYQHLIFLDASSAELFRLSCQQQCQRFGLEIQYAAWPQLQAWLHQQNHSLLIIENLQAPFALQLADFAQQSAHDFLFCCAPDCPPNQLVEICANACMALCPSQAKRRSKLDVLAPTIGQHWLTRQLAQAWLNHQASATNDSTADALATQQAYLSAFQMRMPTAHLHAEAESAHQLPAEIVSSFLLNRERLSTGAKYLFGIFAWLGPSALPYLLILQAEDAATRQSWQQCAEELIALQFCQAGQISETAPAASEWTCLELSPSLQALQRALGEANDVVCALQLMQDILSAQQLPAAVLPYIASHLEYLLGHQVFDAENAALLLQLLEQHYQDQPLASEALLRRILALKHAGDLPHGDANTLACQNLLAQNLKSQGRYDEAQQLLFSALQLAREHLGEHAPQTCIYLNNLARLFAARGQHLAAVELEQQALAILLRADDTARPQVLTLMHNLAHSLLHLPADEVSERILQHLVQIHLRFFGECDWRSQAVMDQLAGNLFAQQKLAEAARWSERVLAVRKQLFGLHHAETTVAAYDLMCLYFELEKAGPAYQIFNDYLLWLQDGNHPPLSEEQLQIEQLTQAFLPSGGKRQTANYPTSQLIH